MKLRQGIMASLRSDLSSISALIPERLVSWEIYWGLAPVSVITAVFFIQPAYETTQVTLTWVAIGLLSHLSMAPFVLYVSGKYSKPVHIIFILTMGLVRGGTIALISPMLLVDDPLSLVNRAIGSAISVLYWFGIGSILTSVWAGFERNLRVILAEAMNSSESRLEMASVDPNKADANDAIRGLISNLNKYIGTATQKEGYTHSLQEQARAIDELVNNHIRPHSAQRWRESELIWPRIRIQNVMYRALGKTVMPILPVLVLLFPLSLVGGISRVGLLRGGVTQVLSTILTFVTFEVSCAIATKQNLSAGRLNLVLAPMLIFINALALIPVGLFWQGRNQFSFFNIFGTQVAASVTFLIVSGVISIIFVVQKTKADGLALLRESISVRALTTMVDQGIAASTKSDYAQYLHAEVQSQLLACKLLLLRAAESDFEDFSPEVTQKVLRRLQLLDQPYETRPTRIPSERLLQMANTWQGLARVKLELATELESISSNGEVISQLIEESIVNAIRHGKAKNVKVTARVEGDKCFIVVQDDGTLKSSKHKGLGSTLFEIFAPDWTLTTNEIGTLATLSAKYN